MFSFDPFFIQSTNQERDIMKRTRDTLRKSFYFYYLRDTDPRMMRRSGVTSKICVRKRREEYGKMRKYVWTLRTT